MWSAGSGGGRPLPGLWGARKDAGSPGTRVAGHRGTRGASERRGSGVQGCAAPGLRNILLRDCRGSGNVGPRNTSRGQEEESNWGRKQEAAGFFFFFFPPLEQPTLAPDWPWPVTRPAGRTELEADHPGILRCRRRLRCCLWAVAVLHRLASRSGLGKGGVQGPGPAGCPARSLGSPRSAETARTRGS